MSDFGVYVHVPFCARRCDYCAFATYDDRDDLRDRYVEAVITEISLAVAEGLPRADTVFFGGGTPSRLRAEQLIRILAAIPRTEGAEITVECNPEDATVERLRAYREGGVTRMSFGVQSTNPHVLADLGRRHGTGAHRDVAAAVAAAGFTTWNADLIVGSRAESLADVRRSVHDLLSLDFPPTHVSCYVLTPEPATPLGRDPSRHPDEDEAADAYQLAGELLEAAGYRFEEISNWALPGHECRHNHVYWQHGNYRGFGSAAHSHDNGRRFWNVRTPERYLAAVEGGTSPLGGEEYLDERASRFERESLALRTTTGVHVSAFDDLEGVEELIEREGDMVRLSRHGRLLANQVILRLASASS